MLGQRLDKLETDLKVLNAMQDMLLQLEEGNYDSLIGCPNPNLNCIHNNLGESFPVAEDIPVKDVITKAKGRNHCVIRSQPIESNRRTKPGERISNQSHAFPDKNTDNLPTLLNNATSSSLQVNSPITDEREDKEKGMLEEQAAKERCLRIEVEESAKHVYLKLQKVEDELEREKKTKESLLSGTLQLKNLIHGYSTKIKELNEELALSKTETQRLTAEAETIMSEQTKTLKNLKSLVDELGFKDATNNFAARLNKDSLSVEAYIEFLSSHIHEVIKRLDQEESEQVQKIRSELAAASGQSEKFKNEIEIISKELKQCRYNENQLKQQLHISQVSLTTVESELLKKQVEYECTVKQIKADSQIEKDKCSVKLSEYSSVIRRSKELLLVLRNERDKSKVSLQKVNAEAATLADRIKKAEMDKESMKVKIESLTQRITSLSTEKLEVVERMQRERLKLESSVQKSVFEKKKCLQLLNEMKTQLVNVKNKCQHETTMNDVEKQRLLTENKRLDENLRVLQKISEDQGRTIQKVRGDLDNIKSNNFNLESKVRDLESAENQFLHKLEKSDKKIECYTQQIENLEDRLEKKNEEIRSHDCEDYVDSRYKRKLNEVEKSFQTKSNDWEVAFREIESERDDALQTAKKTLEKVDELKEFQTSQLSQVKAQFNAEISKLTEQYNKQNIEKQNKIQELQSELDRIKLSSSQTQRALSTKIQQLQAALNICIGGSHQNNNASLGLLHQLHYQQHQLPVAPFGNSEVGVNNKSCANNNGASSANLLLNTTTSGCCASSGAHQTQTTCLGNSNVNGCTSAILTEACPTTGNLGVGFIGSLI